MFVKAYLPHPIELPEAVQHNADGDRVILEVQNRNGTTCQVVFENDNLGDMVVTLRGWGNKPMSVGNMENTNFRATIPMELQSTCEVCGTSIELGDICPCML